MGTRTKSWSIKNGTTSQNAKQTSSSPPWSTALPLRVRINDRSDTLHCPASIRPNQEIDCGDDGVVKWERTTTWHIDKSSSSTLHKVCNVSTKPMKACEWSIKRLLGFLCLLWFLAFVTPFLRSIVVDKESEHVNDGVLVKPGGGAGIHRLIPQDAN
jgi:hypothetical protein